MATTYTRIKNRRGLRADLPQPLADGEIGLAIDTREVYIGTGTQDLLNADVQVKPFLDAQKVVADDLGNLTSSSTNNGILNFNTTGTEFLNPAANIALAYSSNFGLPTGHPKLSGPARNSSHYSCVATPFAVVEPDSGRDPCRRGKWSRSFWFT